MPRSPHQRQPVHWQDEPELVDPDTREVILRWTFVEEMVVSKRNVSERARLIAPGLASGEKQCNCDRCAEQEWERI